MIYINVNYEIVEEYNQDLTDSDLKQVINKKINNIIFFMKECNDAS